MSKYYEESERYFREYEFKNGLNKDYVDHERRTNGSPFRRIDQDYNRPLDWPDSRIRNGAIYSPNSTRNKYSRPTSIPPVRRLPYNVGNQSQVEERNLPPSYLSSPYTGRYIPTSPNAAPISKATDTKQSQWPYYSSEFNPRAYQDRYEAERPYNKGPLLEGTQPLFQTQSIYPTPSPTQYYQTPNFHQYTSRPGSPQQIVGVGEIINSDIGFTIQLDVKHFKAKDIKVTLVGHTLTVSGERIDEDPATEQTLKRSFSRKYSIPTDILLDTIKAHLTDSGLLLIRGQRRNLNETEIQIEVLPEEHRPKEDQPKKVKDAPIAPAQPQHHQSDKLKEPTTGQTTTTAIQLSKELPLRPRPELTYERPATKFEIPPYDLSNSHLHKKRKPSRDSILKNSSPSVTV